MDSSESPKESWVFPETPAPPPSALPLDFSKPQAPPTREELRAKLRALIKKKTHGQVPRPDIDEISKLRATEESVAEALKDISQKQLRRNPAKVSKRLAKAFSPEAFAKLQESQRQT